MSALTPRQIDDLNCVYYVLRRKRDGVFMPAYKGAAGGTYVDPDKPHTHSGTPRLFRNPKAAGDALRWWAQGMVRMDTDTEFLDGHPISQSQIIGKSEPVPGRNAADWEVVAVKIMETAMGNHHVMEKK